MCISVYVSVPMNARVLDPLELELKALVIFLMWVLGSEIWSSDWVVKTLNCYTMSLGPNYIFN